MGTHNIRFYEEIRKIISGYPLLKLSEYQSVFTGLLVAHFENIGFYIGSSYSKYRIFTGFSIKNIG